MYLMRFDLRAPGRSGAQRAALHRTAVEMARYVDDHACGSLVVSEHHASDDGYLPSPFLLASAMAAATRTTPIAVAVAILPLYDPVRLAEDIVTLDHLSEGRAMIVLGLGYRPSEYELYGVDFRRRGALADDKLARLLDLLHDADLAERTPRVTPGPFTSPTPLLAWGGGSIPAARRAGRHGLGFFAQNDGPGMREAYEAAAREAGHEPGLCVLPAADAPYSVFVADDVDSGWDDVGPSLLVDAVAYHAWNAEAGTADTTVSLSSASTVEELRAADGAHQVVTPDGARAIIRDHGMLGLHPLCGGLDPDLAWPYLRRAVTTATT